MNTIRVILKTNPIKCIHPAYATPTSSIQLEITVYKVLNMDDSLQKVFINPPELCGLLYMMDGWTLFGLQNLDTHSLPLKKLEEPEHF